MRTGCLIGVGHDELTHAEVAGVQPEQRREIAESVVTKRRFINDREVVAGSFFDQLWRRQIPTPLKEGAEYLQQFAIA